VTVFYNLFFVWWLQVPSAVTFCGLPAICAAASLSDLFFCFLCTIKFLLFSGNPLPVAVAACQRAHTTFAFPSGVLLCRYFNGSPVLHACHPLISCIFARTAALAIHAFYNATIRLEHGPQTLRDGLVTPLGL